jgi:hypothetical protein
LTASDSMMTWDEVVRAYDKTVVFDDTTLLLIMFGILFFLTVSSFIVCQEFWLSFGVSAIITALLIAPLTFHFVDNKEKSLRQEWVKKHAIPFIEELPTQKIVVDKYFITNEESHSSFFTEKEDFKTMRIQGKNGNGEPVDLILNVKIQPKKNIQKPYVIYKKLKKDLPYKFKKGYYNAVLFVPEDNR